MGGQSYQCPICARWEFTVKGLRDHWRDAHRIIKVEFVGTGNLIKIKSSEPTKERHT